MVAPRDKVIITCAVTGSIHTPTMSPAPAHHPGRDRRGVASARPRRARRSSTSTPATRGPARPTPDPEVFCEFLPRHRGTDRCGHQHHHRRRPEHDRRGAPGRGAATRKPEMASLNMGSMNFGLFHMAERYHEFEVRLGADVPRAQPGLHLPQHVRRHGARRCASSATSTARGSSSSATTSGHLYNLAHFLDRGVVRAAAVRPDDLRHPRRHRGRPRERRPHAAHRRQAVRGRLPLVGARAPGGTRWAS